MIVPAISVQGLKKQFPAVRPWTDTLLHPFRRQWVAALDGVDLEILPGEILGLAGPNGAGKTTLLKILCTQILPTEGRAFINGHDVVRDSRGARRHLGYCMDAERSFYARLSGTENLKFFAAMNDLEPAAAKDTIQGLIRTLELEDVADRRFMTYSKGTRQKLALARGLLTDPPIILLDEPTESLDPQSAQEFRRWIRSSLARELRKTILLVTHNMEELEECCDRAAVMKRGKVVFQGSPADVRRHVRLEAAGGGAR